MSGLGAEVFRPFPGYLVHTTEGFPAMVITYGHWELIYSDYHRVSGRTVAGWHVMKMGAGQTATYMPRRTETEAKAYADAIDAGTA